MGRLTGVYADRLAQRAADAAAEAAATWERCRYTGIVTWYDPQADEYVAETQHGSRRYGRSRGEAFSEALDALRIEREHARTNEEIPFDGSTPQSVIDAENLREVEAYGPSF